MWDGSRSIAKRRSYGRGWGGGSAKFHLLIGVHNCHMPLFFLVLHGTQIEKVKARKPHEKSAAREAALREVKERNKKAKATKMAQKQGATGPKNTGKQKGGKGR